MSNVVNINSRRYPAGSRARHAVYGFVEIVDVDDEQNTRQVLYTTFDTENEPSLNTASVHMNELSTDNPMLYLLSQAQIPSVTISNLPSFVDESM